MAQVFQVNDFVDKQKIGPFNFNILFWCFLAMFADGYDLNSLGFALPEILRQWEIDDASVMGPALSASLVGILFGAPGLGMLGDRYGRKLCIVLGCLIYGSATLGMIWASSPGDIMLLRFLAGIGIGGIMPNTIALNSELAPKRFRATLIILMFMGITTGSGMPGFVSAYLVEDYGWQIIFIIGGVLPLLIALCLYFFLPESIKFLAAKVQYRRELLEVARRMRPELEVRDDAEFVSQHEAPGSARLGELFKGGLAIITPLLWLCFASSLMANFFLNNWLPYLFESYGIPTEQAALTVSLYHFGGTAGGLVVSLLLDRMGYSVIALLFALAVPCVAMIGAEGLSSVALGTIAGLAGFTVLGAQFGNNASAGLLYPTHCRSMGVGWALAIGRFGAIAGPMIGAYLISRELSMLIMFQFAALPTLIGFLAALLLSWLCYNRFKGFQLDDTAVEK